MALLGRIVNRKQPMILRRKRFGDEGWVVWGHCSGARPKAHLSNRPRSLRSWTRPCKPNQRYDTLELPDYGESQAVSKSMVNSINLQPHRRLLSSRVIRSF